MNTTESQTQTYSRILALEIHSQGEHLCLFNVQCLTSMKYDTLTMFLIIFLMHNVHVQYTS